MITIEPFTSLFLESLWSWSHTRSPASPSRIQRPAVLGERSSPWVCKRRCLVGCLQHSRQSRHRRDGKRIKSGSKTAPTSAPKVDRGALRGLLSRAQPRSGQGGVSNLAIYPLERSQGFLWTSRELLAALGIDSKREREHKKAPSPQLRRGGSRSRRQYA